MYKLTNQLINKKVTPQECEKFLELNNFPGQRRLQEFKARRYSELLLQGALRPVEIAFATCPDGARYLMNGQHVCQACRWAGREMSAIISYYKCETWRDAWELFATFDVHATRTQGQIFFAARGMFTNEALREVPMRLLQNAGSALATLASGSPQFGHTTKTADKASKVRLVEAHANEVLWINSIPDNEFLGRVGVLTAMVATYRKNPAKADSFWRSVQAGIGFKSLNDPAKKLRDYISGLSGWRSTSTDSRQRHSAIYCICISWWNSHISGEVRTSVKLAAMKEIPKVLA